MRDAHAVVGDGNPRFCRSLNPGKHLAAVQHTAAAVNDQFVFGQVVRIVASRVNGHIKVRADVLTEPVRDLDAPDVVICRVVRTGFGDQNLVACFECVDRGGPARHELHIAFQSGKEDRERGAGDFRRSLRDHFGYDLRVAHHEVRRGTELIQHPFVAGFLDGDDGGVGIKSIADRLDLRKNEAPFWRLNVDGDDEHRRSVRTQEVADQRGGGDEIFRHVFDQRLFECGKTGVAAVSADAACGDDRPDSRVAEFGQKCVAGSAEIAFVDDRDDGDVFLFCLGENGFFRRVPVIRFTEDDRDVRAVECLPAPFDALSAEFGGVVDSGGIEEDDRAEWEQFHAFFYYVGCGSGNGGGDGGILSGDQIEKT